MSRLEMQFRHYWLMRGEWKFQNTISTIANYGGYYESENRLSGIYRKYLQSRMENEFNFEAQRKKTDSDNALKTARLYAQRKAIDKTFVDALLTYYPEVSEKEIWGALAMAHKLNVANLNEFGIDSDKQQAVFEACLSAHQSWIKSSGHSFERYISNIDNDKLKKNEIRFILQSELTDMVKRKS